MNPLQNIALFKASLAALGYTPGAQDILAAKAYTDSAVAALAGGTQAGGTTGIVSGGNYAWTSALSYVVSAATYLIDGTEYSSAETSITLDAADATNPRFDLIVLDADGTVKKITGDPAAQPSEPAYDPTTQIKLTLVSVPANATEPVGAATETVYEEGTGGEWTDTSVGSGINTVSTSNPRSGTKVIEATAAANGAYVLLTRASASSLSTLNTLTIYMRSKAQFSNGRAVKVQFFLNGVAKGNALVIAAQAISSFGFDTSQTASYQVISIPLSQFVLPAGATVDQLRITAVNSGTGWYIDDVKLSNTGTTIVSTTSGISQEIADARYVPKGAATASGLTLATARVLGRITAATGAPEELTAAQVADFVAQNIKPTECIPIACSDETTALTTGTKVTFRMPYAFTLTAVRGSVTTAATGATLLAFDVKESGTSIFSTKPTFDASGKTTTTAATSSVLSDTALADDAEITVIVDAVGNTIAGAGLKVYLIGHRT